MAPHPKMSGEASLARHKLMSQSMGIAASDKTVRPSSSAGVTQLHVRNIHPELNEGDVRRRFEQYGTVAHIKMVHRNPDLPIVKPTPAHQEDRDPEYRNPNPQFGYIYAYVHMSKAAEAAEAMKNLDGRVYRPGWSFTVRPATQPMDKRPRPQQGESSKQTSQQNRQRELEQEEQQDNEKEREAADEEEGEEEEGEEVTVNNIDALSSHVRDRHDLNLPAQIKASTDPAVLPGLIKLWHDADDMRSIAWMWSGRADGVEFTSKLWTDQDMRKYQNFQNAVMSVLVANLQANSSAGLDYDALVKRTRRNSKTRRAVLEEMLDLGKAAELRTLPQRLPYIVLGRSEVRAAVDAVDGRTRKRGKAEFYFV